MKKYVLYYRTSPKKQSRLTRGLNAQKITAHRFVEFNDGAIVAEYTEIETRPNKRLRPVLREAASHAKSAGATLLIAKLDRMARNVAFTSALMETGVEFVCCDNQHANHLTLHLLAATAQAEGQMIRDRIKAANAEMKAKGIPLGSARPEHWKGREHKRGWKKACKVAATQRTERTREIYSFLMPRIKQMREEGRTMQQIADTLNAEGHRTTHGKPFGETSIHRLIDRYLDKELLGNNKWKMAAAVE
jgi:DNA invertase Pin-like site-specific DNA recombinase